MELKDILKALNEKKITPEEAKKKLQEFNSSFDEDKPNIVSEDSNKNISNLNSKIYEAENSGGNFSEQDERIAIIGISGRYPDSENINQFWGVLSNGKSAIKEIPESRWDMSEYYDPEISKEGSIYCKWMGMLEDVDCFDSLFFEIPPSEAEMMDPQHRLFLQEGYRAFEDAGYSRSALNHKKCGVYLGIVNGEYNIQSQQSSENSSVTAHSNAIGAARIAYYLNLKGPAISIDTACSSSLVSTHLAIQALLRGEIDMALAGGVSLYLTPESYISMCSAGMLSADGQCKAFDNSANGFVPGEGVGAVVLKRLKDAQDAGDYIYGVIIGSAINQDGKTNGITAPNLGSQIELVRDMYDRYNIDPESISYAEMHGTGTKLGDPIELEALSTAFSEKKDAKNYCAIGSVKSNIGHTSAAAAMAGIHKILLSMKHKKLVPTLHVNTPNEHFDFNHSPFYINRETNEWNTINGYPRRASISSFGYSGTNAHAVIEEYDMSNHQAGNHKKKMEISSNSPGIFVLSAKNETQLNIYVENMKDYLEANPELDIANFLYTLQIGRESMDERLAILTSGLHDLSSKLSIFLRNGANGTEILRGGITRNKIRNKVDKQDIAEKEVYKDRSACKYNVLANRWIAGETVDWEREYAVKPRRIPLPAYPFEKEVHWLQQRARNTHQERVVMNVLHPLLHENVSDFSEQCFRSVFTGQEFFLKDHMVQNSKIFPAAAMLEMARAAGEISGGKQVSSISNISWVYPIKVNEDGQTVYIRLYPEGDHQAAFELSIPDESAKNSDEEILCAEGTIEYKNKENDQLEQLNIEAYKSSCQLMIESKENYEAVKNNGLVYGPRFQTLEEIAYNENEVLARVKLNVPSSKEETKEYCLHPGLLDGALQTISIFLQNEQENKVYLPFSLGKITIHSSLSETGYVYTTAVKTERHNDTQGRLIKSFDITVTDDLGNISAVINDFNVKPIQEKKNSVKNDKAVPNELQSADQVSALYFKHVWEAEKANSSTSLKKSGAEGALLLFDMNNDLRKALENKINDTVILVKPGVKHRVIDQQTFVMNPSNTDGFEVLLQALRDKGIIPGRIIYNWPCDDSISKQNQLDERLERGVYSMLALTQALMAQKTNSKIQLLYVYKAAMKNQTPEQGAMSGFFRTLQMENQLFDYKTVELKGAAISISVLSEILLGEFDIEDERRDVRHDGKKRWVKKIRALDKKKDMSDSALIKNNGVYMITGGLGGLGIIFARYLSEKVKAKLILTGRRKPDADERAMIKELEARGSEVLYIKADISNRQETAELVSKAKGRFHKIDGVIHAAGVLKDSLFWNKTPEEMSVVLAAKVYGTRFLDEILKDEHLDFFAMFSSLASVFGNIGQCDYSYANCYMDHFAENRENMRIQGKRYGKTISINWPFWISGGMGIDFESRKAMEEKSGLIPLEIEEGIRTFEDGLCLNASQLVLVKGKINQVKWFVDVLNGEADKVSITDSLIIENENISEVETFREETEEFLREVLSGKTKIDAEKINVLEPFEIYGIDSILIMSLTRVLEKSFGELSKTLFYEYRNLKELTDYFLNHYSEKIINMFGKPSKTDKGSRLAEENISEDSDESALKKRKRSRFLTSETTVKKDIGDIAIIGVSGRYPMADNLEQFWENLKNGKDCISEIPKDRWDYRKYFDADKQRIGKAYSKWGGFINDVSMFDPLFFNIPPIEAEQMDPQARLFMQTAWQAIEDAGYTRALLEKDKVGVFVGVMYGMYQLFEGEVKGKRVPIGSSFASIANQVSYFCNFTGPSMAVDTMCSSSLTALHLGCESIKNGESDLVIAGGVNLTLHPNKHIMLSMGKFASSDGRCRSFGEGGDGYVPGEGVGAVLLKPLEKAVKDRDHIYGVIKGSSINSGGKTSGFTVPNPNAQGDLIEDVLQKANINARTISYIESHGTGTALGDPIEVTGLTKSFGKQTTETQFCSVGSVKSNIGHLESASGIAALTKVLLQMENHQLVPSIHSENLNPNINFKKTPFYIQQKLEYWDEPVIFKDGKETKVPRRAGISSFGAGGANAHVIVEEYKFLHGSPTVSDHTPMLFVLSARNEERLREYAKLLIEYLQKKNGIQQKKQSGTSGENLIFDDIRNKITCISANILGIKETNIDAKIELDEYGFDFVQSMRLKNEIEKELEIYLPDSVFNLTSSIHSIAGYISELLPQDIESGSISKGIFADLPSIAYTLQVGREAMEERLAIIAKNSNELVRKLTLFINGKNENQDQFYKGNILDAKQKIKSTIGEKTCAKTVSSLIETNELGKIAELWVTGKEIDWNQFYKESKPYRISLPAYPFAKERYWPKGMLESLNSRHISVEEMHPLVIKNTSNVYELRYSTVFNGQEFFLKDHVINGKKVLPGVVYLEMAWMAVESALEVADQNETVIHIHNVVWQRPFEVTSGAAALHISLEPEDSGEIKFAIYSQTDNASEETVHCQGSVLIDQDATESRVDIDGIMSKCGASKVSGESFYQLFESIGISYGPSHKGIESVYIGEDEIIAELSIPKKVLVNSSQYTLHPSLLDAALQATIAFSLSDDKMLGTILSDTEKSQEVKLPFAVNEIEILKDCSSQMLAYIRKDKQSKSKDKMQKLNIDLCDLQGNVCIRISQIAFKTYKAGSEKSDFLSEQIMFSKKWTEKSVTANSKRGSFSRRLVILCEPEEKFIQDVELCLQDTKCIALRSNAQNIADKFTDYTVQLLKEVKKLSSQMLYKEQILTQLFIVTESENKVLAGFSGFLKTVQLENHNMICQLIESQKECSIAELCRRLEESGTDPVDQQVRYTENGRFVSELKKVEVRPETGICWKDSGVYLITGGAGGLGLILANEIANKGKNVTLVLVGRSSLTEDNRRQIRKLERDGVRVIYRQADVADKQQVNGLIQGTVEEFGDINGVIHCSGIIRDHFIIKKNETELRDVLAPKVSGIYNLDQATKDVPLDLFIIFSSMAAVTGNIGQADYAVANAFMDQFAAYRNGLGAEGKRCGHTVSINWPLWREGGMKISIEMEKAIQEVTGLIPMHTATGIELLYESISSGESQILALEGSTEKLNSYLFNSLPVYEFDSGDLKQEEQSDDQNRLKDKFAVALKHLLSSELKLDVERIDSRVPLETYGINSTMIIQLTNELEKTFGVLPKTLFFEYQSLMELAEYFSEAYPNEIIAMLGIKKKDPEAIPLCNNPSASEKQRNGGSKAKGWRWKEKNETRAVTEMKEINDHHDSREEIAIIGLAGKYPQADHIGEFWINLKNGKDCITEIPKDRWDHSIYYDKDKSKSDKTYAKWGGFINGVDEFDPLFFNISPKDAQALDPQERLFLQCAYNAIEDAGYTRHTLGKGKEYRLESNVGVFVGVMYEEYQLYGAQAQARGNRYTLNGSPASIANRVSYACGFHGPSMAIDTMCSSSLVSIHLACQSILFGECEAAIAGGVNLSLHPNKFLMLGQNRFMSSKGRCESFGKGGDGYTPGEGVGAVILKPKAKAIADGDHIYGVIKGTALNHGGKTNGYTVPNPRAQASLIKKAFKKSGVNARTISYIEAHGTGTSLGDPIEISGLKKAFGEQTKDKQFCLIGSAKSNIGHCESAAGIAGLTKVLLQMENKLIVPSLHSAELNPDIDFVNSPFIVSQGLTEWKRPMIEENGETKEYPRIAGISAFGAGGSNAHVIVEEYIPESSVEFNSDQQNNEPIMITLSARKEEQLQEQVKQFISWNQKRLPSDAELKNIAYTLQVGREAMEERLAFTVTSISELNQKLTDFLQGSGDYYRGKAKRINNVLNVLDSDKEFQSVLGKWFIQGENEKILELWVKGLNIEWGKFYSDKKFRRISLPTYPFAKESYWIPNEETQSQEYELAVNSHHVIHPLVHHNTSDFNQQRYSSVFTGRETFFSDHLVNGRKTMPAAAYIEMVYASISNALNSDETYVIQFKDIVWIQPVIIDHRPVQIHIELDLEENGEIAFRVFSLSEDNDSNQILYCKGYASLNQNNEIPKVEVDEIRSQCCLERIESEKIYDHFKSIGIDYGLRQRGIEFLDLGESQVLAHLKMSDSLAETVSEYTLHPCIMDSALQAAIGIEEDAVHMFRGQRVSTGDDSATPRLPFMIKKLTVYKGCSPSMWVNLRPSHNQVIENDGEYLDIDLFDSTGNICVKIEDIYFRAVKKGDRNSLSEKPSIAENVTPLTFTPKWEVTNIEKAEASYKYSKRIVILCDVNEKVGSIFNSECKDCHIITLKSQSESIAKRFTQYALDLFETVKNEISCQSQDQVLIQVAVSVTNDRYLLMGLAGLLKTAHLENPNIHGQVIGIKDDNDAGILAEKLTENAKYSLDHSVLYENGKRFTLKMEECFNYPAGTQTNVWKNGGVYLITGGMGGLGLIFAREITHQVKNAVVVLTGRSPLTEDKQAVLNELSNHQVKVVYRQADVSVEGSMVNLLEGIHQDFGEINGIIHSAGLVMDNFIYKKTKKELSAVLSPKVQGTINLDLASREMELDFFVLCSSLSGITGNVGQADYAAANAFIDAFAAYREDLVNADKRKGKTISINWPLWKEGGILLDESFEKAMSERTGITGLRTETGLKLFYQSLAMNQSQIIAVEGYAQKIRSVFIESDESIGNFEKVKEITGNESEGNFNEKAMMFFKQIFAEALNIPIQELDEEQPLDIYGIDSIFVMKLTEQLEKTFGPLPKTLLFECQSIHAITHYFVNKYADQFPKLTGCSAEEHLPEVVKSSTSAEQKNQGITARKNSRLMPSNVKKTETLQDIAIIGMSGAFAQAENLNEFWDNLHDGRDCISEVPLSRWDHSKYFNEDKDHVGTAYTKWGGFMKNIDCFDPLFFNISPADAEIMDPQERLFMQSVYEAIEDAGYTRQALGYNPGSDVRRNVGVYVGVMSEDYQLYAAQEQKVGNPIVLSGNPSSIANRVSYFFDFHGPSLAVDTMCSSSLVAIHMACQAIKHGECELAVTGGVNVISHPNKYLLISQGKFASTNGRCVSFGKGGDGYVPGEGVGALLLKPKDKAVADGDHIYGVIKATSINHGGKTNGYTVPNPAAQSEVIRTALEESNISPDKISYVEAHGTGTALGDPIEIAALTKAYGDKASNIAIGSVKSNIGHCESASGIAAISKVLLQMRNKKIVPSLHSSELNPNIDFKNSPFFVPQEVMEWKRPVAEVNGEVKEHPRIAGISSFGAGGANAHIILEEYTPEQRGSKPADSQSMKPAVIVLSAKSKDQLYISAKNLLDAIENQNLSENDLSDIAYTLQVGREAMEERIAFVAHSRETLVQKLKAFVMDHETESEIYYGQVYGKRKFEYAFTSADGLNKAVKDCIDRAQYDQLCAYWVNGVKFDWNNLYRHRKPKRISLPTYPFEREKYWVKLSPEMPIENGNQGEGNIHPLIHKNLSSLYNQRFCSNFSGNEFFLRDHRLGERKVLPGSAILEMTRIAGELSTEDQINVIKDIVWTNQIEVKSETVNTEIRLYPNEQTIDFEISIPSEAEEHEPVICTEGKLEFRESLVSKAREASIDIEQIQARCRTIDHGQDCYDSMKASGLINGNTFQVIQEIHSNESEALGYLKLSPDMEETNKDYVLHPALLNGAFQTVLGLIERNVQSESVILLPFAITEIRIYESLVNDCVAYVTRSSHAQNSQSSIQKFDIKIADRSGKTLVCVDEFTLKAFNMTDQESQSSMKQTNDSDFKTYLYTTEWCESESQMNRDDEIIPQQAKGSVIVFDQDEKLYKNILEQLRQDNDESEVILVNPGKVYRQKAKHMYDINPMLQDDYQNLLQKLEEHGLQPDRIILYRDIESSAETNEDLNDHLEQGIYSMFYLSQALIKQKIKTKIRLLFTFVNNKEEVIPEYSAISGFSKTIRMENPAFLLRTVEIQKADRFLKEGDISNARLLLNELDIFDSEVEVRYEGNIRLVKGIKELSIL
ncbi:hypothetical protein BSF_07040 [Bacillus subtilis]|uniref:SDR family NAD(P)-dependent oxidoreductase n=1 Tax=Bacillus TaxID=1386 RepID=UPI00084A4F94|nr:MULTISPECIES: SDR family NAD(P)-dependent oxidoreductase [Bacillus]OEC77142.1 hypothetical protein BCV60_08800 [Bacillus halotolerans]UZD52156.1 SDR family NAD(P)-dependent oxidoreductase [Bacillus halotolerans]WEY45817.1 SDR family NAD(P)-dependent oxidoreductase [Bacillus sp. B28]BDG78975.1 hypothetical protein BSF_07040 [Bacillus subtilis]